MHFTYFQVITQLHTHTAPTHTYSHQFTSSPHMHSRARTSHFITMTAVSDTHSHLCAKHIDRSSNCPSIIARAERSPQTDKHHQTFKTSFQFLQSMLVMRRTRVESGIVLTSKILKNEFIFGLKPIKLVLFILKNTILIRWLHKNLLFSIFVCKYKFQ